VDHLKWAVFVAASGIDGPEDGEPEGGGTGMTSRFSEDGTSISLIVANEPPRLLKTGRVGTGKNLDRPAPAVAAEWVAGAASANPGFERHFIVGLPLLERAQSPGHSAWQGSQVAAGS
jgi:hypothetical protein